ncbi:MAG: hypothetical protein H7837_00045 [Magnetococcus sp. MYC-9]
MDEKRFAGGFTLVETAMVMLILSLLLGGLLQPLSIQRENLQRRETQEQLERIHEALLGYTLVHGHLPCPDRSNTGREERQGTGCVGDKNGSVWHGRLPWVTLGVGEQDAWHNRFTYAVAEPFADSSKAPWPAFTQVTAGAVEVVHGIDHTPAVVFSHGANGLGAVSAQGVSQSAAVSVAERENTDGDNRFILAPYHNDSVQGFDDQLVWVSPYLLANRLLLAGRLKPWSGRDENE